MAQGLPARLWHTAREYAGHWLVAGIILAATGAAPEHWFADLLHGAHLPTESLHLWGAGIDLRLIRIGAGVLMIAGDIAWRRTRPPAQPASSAPALPLSAEALPLPDRPSIAVLPFANLSGDPEQEYFSDGIADDIITELSRSHALFVIARNSSFTYRGRAVDVKQVAHELGVRYVVEGSVRREADRVRVNAQLIDAGSGAHIWAERYDRALEQVFAVQDEITAAIVAAIHPAVADAELRRMLRKPPENLGAWEAYQRGLWHVGKASRADIARAMTFFQRAIELDAGFAPAYTGLASAYTAEGAIHAARPLQEAVRLAADWARRAVEIDATDAEAQAMLARTATLAGNAEEGWERAMLALSLNPNSPLGNLTRAGALVYGGKAAEGRDAAFATLRLDPRNPRNSTATVYVTISYHLERNYPAAVEWAKRTIARYPDDPRSYRWLAAALGQLGRADEARAALQEALRISPQSFEQYVRQRPAFIPPDDHAHTVEGLRKAGWQG
jgi:adenylate cyclase